MKTWAKWLIGIFGTVVVAIVAVVVMFDWNWLRDPASGYASKSSGREITIGGIEGEWKLEPRIVLTDLHVSNVDWAREDEMISIERAEIVIDLPQLLRGRTVLPEITLIKPKVSLEKDKDGKSNWNFAAREAADTVTPDERSEAPLIGRLTIEDGRVIYRDPVAGLDIDGQISTATGTGGEGRTNLEFQGQGKLNGEEFKMKASGGSLLSLRESDQAYPLTIEIDAVSTHAKISGTLEDPIAFNGLDLQAELEGPDLSRITKITGVPLPITPPYRLAGRLERDGLIWSGKGIKGKLGNSDIAGNLKYDASRERPYIEADLTSKVIDYRDVGAVIGVDLDEPKKQSAEGKPRVLPDAPLSVEQVRNVDAKVRFKGEKVDAPNTPLSGVELNLDLKNGVLKIQPLNIGMAGGITNAFITIDARQPDVVTDYDLRLKGYRLERFVDSAGLEGKASGRIEGRIRLNGIGNTVAKSLGTATGDIRLVMESGDVSNLGMELAGIDIAESLGFLAKGDKQVPLRCFVADFEVKDGAFWPRTFVFDTTDTTLTADGGGNFKDESLNLRISAHPKGPSLVAARTPVLVRGYFGEPSVGVEKAPLVARGAAAVALGVLLTPLASILAFIEPGGQLDSNCQMLLQQNKVTE